MQHFGVCFYELLLVNIVKLNKKVDLFVTSHLNDSFYKNLNTYIHKSRPASRLFPKVAANHLERANERGLDLPPRVRGRDITLANIY